MSEKKKLFLIDASAYFYRAFFALPNLSTSEGLPTNAIYGFTTMLQKLIKEQNPHYIAAILDCPEPTFRHEAYQEYKANREEMPDNLSAQIPYMKDVFQAFNIPAIEKPGYEADDIIGTLAKQAVVDGVEVVIVTGDKDMHQLVGPGITLLDTMKNTVSDADAVTEKYGVGPEKMVDMFGLMGDSVDNVPGVPGIGPKTAVSLIQQFGSIDGVYENLEKVSKKKVKESLEKFKEQAYLSRELVTIDTRVPLDSTWKDFRMNAPDEEILRSLYKKFEFTRLLKALSPEKQIDKTYQLVTDRQAIAGLFSQLRQQSCFALDLETTSEDPIRAEIVGISFACKDNEAFYVPVAHRNLKDQPEKEFVLSQLKPLLEDSSIKKTGHNIKYEYIIFKKHGITLRGITCDTMVASYVLNPSKYKHSLDAVSLDYLDYRTTAYKDVVGTGRKALTFDQVPIEEAKDYACEDSDITLILSHKLLPKVKESGLEDLFYRIEMPLIKVLAEMEMTGVKVDMDHLKKLSVEFGKELETIEKKIYDVAGEKFNINSPKQLGGILFEKLNLPVQKRTKTGYATDISTLTELSKMHPLPAEILSFRSLAKLKSTYIDNMPALVNQASGRIHTSYNQTVTATGRLSSSEPNLQNIPIRTEEGIRIREAFICGPGWKILSADYSQIELRILAHLSEDETLIDAFLNNEDIHSRTASEIWGVKPGEVTAQMRREAKVINFGIIYGMSSFGLSRELDIEPRIAQEYIDDYFRKYQGVRSYLDTVLKNARKKGYVATLMNRRRYLPEIKDRNAGVRKFAERTAFNAPIQGTAADLIKIAMIRISEALKAQNLQSRMIIQVHDELVFEVPEKEIETLSSLVKKEMEGVLDMKVPLKVDINWGKNWREAH
jgi:DNA polymerase-1